MRFALAILLLPTLALAKIEKTSGVVYGPAGSPVTLAAAGAFTTGSELAADDFHRGVLYCRYKRGGANGAVQVKFEHKSFNATWHQETRNNTAAASASPSFKTYTWTATGASEEFFILFFDDIYAQSVRIKAAESGNTGAPGTFAAFLVLLKTQRTDAGGR